MKIFRPATALLTVALGLGATAAHAFDASDAKALCKQYVRNRLQIGDSAEWTAEPRWQSMDTASEKKWAVFMDYRTSNVSTGGRNRSAVCQGRFDAVSQSWRITEYSEH